MYQKRLLVLLLLALIVVIPLSIHPAYAQSGMNLDGYCKAHGYQGVKLVQNNAYGWNCVTSSGSIAGMNLVDVCAWQYHGSLPVPKFSDFNNPYSWQCYPNSAPTTPPPAHTPVTYSVDSNLLDRSYVSGVTGANIDAALRAIRPNNNGLIGYGQAFVDTGSRLGINPLYIAAHAAWETGWGTSALWLNKNNPFGYGAYDRCAYSCALTFPSKAEGILTAMTRIKADYLVSGGRYYYSNYGPTLRGMNVKYATDQNWKNGIAGIMTSLAKQLNLTK